ncbi:MAG: hypothetical protein FWF50_07750 [Defluviitaleaceae bacterium]|nr:hypothetical protein [Defluviitaleaceae bacterium]
MPNVLELRSEKKSQLFDLLKLKKENPNLEIKGLNELILRIEASMEEEDVALVEKKIAKL